MTAARVRAQQLAAIGAPTAQTVRCTIASASPLTVVLPGGATVAGVAVAGYTYVVGAAAFALIQEPAVGPIVPIA